MVDTQKTKEVKTELATIGGGCFWCVESIFQRVQGVISVKSGYAGGTVENPTYKQVCSGETGHAEVVQIEFDSSLLSYEELLQIFLRTHDPTTLNKQGYDEGTQYRSIILYHSDDQCETAKKVIQSVEAEKVYSDKIVTEIAPMKTFYSAEDHHQNYYNENPGDRYCTAVIRPKLSKFLKLFKSKAKADAEEVK